MILGPGSWFTSVLPHLLVPSLRRALHLTAAKRVLTLNLELQTRETLGYSAAAHLESLREHAPELRFDIVLADPSVLDNEAELRHAVAKLGAALVVAPIADAQYPGQHDPNRLAAAYRGIIAPQSA